MLQAPYHQGNDKLFRSGEASINGIHQRGWSDDWQRWVNDQKKNGRAIDRESVLERLATMKGWAKYKVYFEDGPNAIGKPATMGYKAWQALCKAKRVARKGAAAAGKVATKAAKAAKRAGKAVKASKVIPWVATPIAILSWGMSVQAKGVVGGTVDTMLDMIPYGGNVKVAAEIASGRDLIPDLPEESSPESAADDIPDDVYIAPDDGGDPNEVTAGVGGGLEGWG